MVDFQHQIPLVVPSREAAQQAVGLAVEFLEQG